MSVQSSAILGSLTMCCAGSKRHGDAIQRFTGILLTGLVAAIGVHALQQATDESVGSPAGEHPARPRPSRDAPQDKPPAANGVVERQVARGGGLTGPAG